VGLAAGEPPATKGYTPSVFAMLPRLLERAGPVEGGGAITGFYTVLVEGDDMTEPIADAVRGVLDGHIILSRAIARRGHYPAIDALDSISRLADELCDEGHVTARRELLKLLAARAEVEDLVQIGAYAAGSNPRADAAIALESDIDGFLTQPSDEASGFGDTRSKLAELALRAGELMNQSARQGAGANQPMGAR
jgi:flagellum-specific ATP synthase